MASSEEGVQATNDDAAHCKRFAVEKGYWSDPYISAFMSRSKQRHAPEINRGYYARVTVIRNAVKKFIEKTSQRCNVISLGAGFDTTCWLLKDSNCSPASYIEMDFMAVTSRKSQQIERSKALLEKLVPTKNGTIDITKGEIHSGDYHLIPCNICNLDVLDSKLSACGTDKSLPTLFIAECVLVYISSNLTHSLMKWISNNFNTVLFLNYEMVNMTDRFGEVMIDNLRKRDCELAGVDTCATMETQKNRFLSNGFDGADGLTMSEVYRFLPQADVQRIERLEFLDETELLDQLLSHYCLVWGWKNPNNLDIEDIVCS